MTDKEFLEWEDKVFGYGYGTGEGPVMEALMKFFDTFKGDSMYDYEVIEEKLGKATTWLLINTLCSANADILEYGTSPRYGFLTVKGELLRGYLQDKKLNEVYELIMKYEPYG